MGRTGRPKAPLVLTDEERLTLERLTSRAGDRDAGADRVVVRGAEDEPRCGRPVAREAMVSKWRRRFVERRLNGLFDEPRPGPPRTITYDQGEAVIIKTLEEKPVDATHWSTRSMAKAMGMSPTSISLIWRALAFSRIEPSTSSCRPTRCSSTRSETDGANAATSYHHNATSANITAPPKRPSQQPPLVRALCQVGVSLIETLDRDGSEDCGRLGRRHPPASAQVLSRPERTPCWSRPQDDPQRGRAAGP